MSAYNFTQTAFIFHLWYTFITSFVQIARYTTAVHRQKILSLSYLSFLSSVPAPLHFGVARRGITNLFFNSDPLFSSGGNRAVSWIKGNSHFSLVYIALFGNMAAFYSFYYVVKNDRVLICNYCFVKDSNRYIERGVSWK